MASNKRKYVDTKTALEFLEEVKVGSLETIRTLVPPRATVRDIRSYIYHKQNIGLVKPWWGKMSVNDAERVTEVLKQEMSNEEILLQKRIVYVGSGANESKKQEELKRKDRLIECKVQGTDVATSADTRNDSITLVLGASGHGKTTYCVNGSIQGTKKDFRVYMTAADLNKDGKSKAVILKEILEQEIRDALSISSTLPCLNMNIVAVIDEAGVDQFYGDKENLLALRDVVREFANGGQLVVSGTGLDLLTHDIGSAGEGFTKVKLLPCQMSDFEHLAKDSSIVALVKKHDVYSNLTTNPRAAERLLDCLLETSTWANEEENVPYVVRNVAFKYIAGNGLKDTTPGQRRRIVRAVLQVLHKCKRGDTTIPLFCNLTDMEKTRASSLINIHVEKSGSTFTLSDGHHFAVSVTPAIAIVLAALLSHTASLLSTWSGFEEIIALQELFRVVRDAEEAEVPEFQVVKLDKPYSAKGGQKNLEVPEAPRTSILINGRGAAFSDVIAHLRLTQVKQTHLEDGEINLFLEDELEKMGLLPSSSTAQKIFMKALYQIWSKQGPPATQKSKSSEAVITDANTLTDPIRKVYPGNLLVSLKKRQKQACRCFTEYKDKWVRTDVTGEADLDSTKLVVNEDKPVTVVFVTNGKCFQIKSNREVQAGEGKKTRVQELTVKSSITLLDVDGTVHDSATHWMKEILKQLTNVVIELEICSC